MLTLDDIRGYIAGLGEYNMVYIGKMDNKREHSIGVYPRKASGQPVTALGGPQYSSYDIRRISLLIHWDKDVRASEQAAYELFEKLRNVSSLMIGDTHVNQISLKLLACRPPPGWKFRKKGKNVVGVRGGKAVNPSFAAQETGSFHTNY